jgi:hypothetical protein
MVDQGREEPAVVVYWVTDGINACHIGFLPWHMIHHHAARYDGVLGQITATFSDTHPNYAVREKWHRKMGFCRAAIISPLNGDAPVVEVASGSVAALGEGVPAGADTAGVPAGVDVAEAVKKFCLGGSLPWGLNLSYFRHWRPMAVLEECNPVVLVLVLRLMLVGRPSAGAHGSKELLLLAFSLSICLLRNYEHSIILE